MPSSRGSCANTDGVPPASLTPAAPPVSLPIKNGSFVHEVTSATACALPPGSLTVPSPSPPTRAKDALAPCAISSLASLNTALRYFSCFASCAAVTFCAEKSSAAGTETAWWGAPPPPSPMLSPAPPLLWAVPLSRTAAASLASLSAMSSRRSVWSSTGQTTLSGCTRQINSKITKRGWPDRMQHVDIATNRIIERTSSSVRRATLGLVALIRASRRCRLRCAMATRC